MKPAAVFGLSMIVVIWILGGGPAAAVTFNPGTFADGADVDPGNGICDSDPSPAVTTCTLRAAVMEANALPGSDDIELADGTYTLTLTGSGDDGGDLDITDDLIILGTGATVIDGGSIDRVLHAADADLQVGFLTLRNGSSYSGGGCIITNSRLFLYEVEITECESRGGLGGALADYAAGGEVLYVWSSWIHGNQATNGGGLAVSATANLVLLDSTVSFNTATAADGGGIYNNGSLFVSNSTLVGNAAMREGGGIYSYSRIRIASSTVAGNSCDLDANGDGGGCGVRLVSGNSDIRNTIIAGNIDWNPSNPITEPSDCAGSFISNGYNLIGFPGTACTGFSAAWHDLVGNPLLDAEIGGLQDNGGFGPTRIPEPGSPAIDGGNPAGCLGDIDGDWNTMPDLLLTEQRGFPRALDDDADGVAVCNIGAVETALFADSFESGDLDRWSSSQP